MKHFIMLAILSATLFSSCKKNNHVAPNAVEKTFDIRDFTKIRAGETFIVHITKGSSFSIKAKGRMEDLDELALGVVAGNFLELKYGRFRNQRHQVEFTITMPVISTVDLQGASRAMLNGYSNQDIRIRTILNGSSECTITGSAEEVQVELDGASVLTITGNATILYGNVQGQAKMNAAALVAKIVEINTGGQSKSVVQAIDNLIVTASGQSEVYYKGEPVAKDIETSGQAKVVRQ